MADIAKRSRHGDSHAPDEHADQTKSGKAVVDETTGPVPTAIPWNVIESLGDHTFMPEGREQPDMPADLPHLSER